VYGLIEKMAYPAEVDSPKPTQQRRTRHVRKGGEFDWNTQLRREIEIAVSRNSLFRTKTRKGEGDGKVFSTLQVRQVRVEEPVYHGPN
jgi:hypothetical protein